jgi:hypothetical protein
MKFMTLSGIASTWLIAAPAIWEHRPAKAIVAGVIGLMALLLSPIGTFWAPARLALATAGGILALSNFVFPDSIGTLAYHSAVGLLFVFTGLAPEIERSVEQAPAAMPAGVVAGAPIPEASAPPAERLAA